MATLVKKGIRILLFSLSSIDYYVYLQLYVSGNYIFQSVTIFKNKKQVVNRYLHMFKKLSKLKFEVNGIKGAI